MERHGMSLRQGEGELKGGDGGSAQLGSKMNTHTWLITTHTEWIWQSCFLWWSVELSWTSAVQLKWPFHCATKFKP